MTQKLGDLLSGRDYSEPTDIQLIKNFVFERVGVTPKVSITSESYIVSVSSAAAAGSLRTHVFKLKKQLDSPRRILIRIA